MPVCVWFSLLNYLSVHFTVCLSICLLAILADTVPLWHHLKNHIPLMLLVSPRCLVFLCGHSIRKLCSQLAMNSCNSGFSFSQLFKLRKFQLEPKQKHTDIFMLRLRAA